MKNEFKLIGHTLIKVNDEVVLDRKNTINPDLREYLADSMIQDIDHSIGANAGLFSTNDTAPSAITGEGGIVVGTLNPLIQQVGKVILDNPIQMVTTEIHGQAVNANGRRWKGELTASAARQFSQALIGEEWRLDNAVEDFLVNYASQSFQTIVLGQGDTLTIEWEIAIQ